MIPESKVCGGCKQDKPESEYTRYFEKSKNEFRLQSYCKECRRIRDVKRLLHRKYGIDRFQFEMILKSQGNVCALCGLPFVNETPEVDHIETPFHVRGIIHGKCNQIVKSYATPDLLRKAVEYLETKDKRFTGVSNGDR